VIALFTVAATAQRTPPKQLIVPHVTHSFYMPTARSAIKETMYLHPDRDPARYFLGPHISQHYRNIQFIEPIIDIRTNIHRGRRQWSQVVYDLLNFHWCRDTNASVELSRSALYFRNLRAL